MQSRLYFSRLGQSFLQRPRISSISFKKRVERQPPILFRFKHDAAQERDKYDGEEHDESLIRPANDLKKSSTLARRPSLWRNPATWVKGSGISKHGHTSRKLHLRRAQILSPPTALVEYLSLQDTSQKKLYCERIKLQLRPSALPHILLHHLYIFSLSNTPWSSFDRSFQNAAEKHLESRGITPGDVVKWGWVLSVDSTDDRIHRFLSIRSEKPQFLLLLILRGDILHVRTLKQVLVYVWNDIIGKARRNIATATQVEKTPHLEALSQNPKSLPRPISMDNFFETLISRLLYQARRIWPAAMISVSQMVGPYVYSVLEGRASPEILDTRTLSRLSQLLNNVLRLLALPATMGPLRSMVYNWSAQKVLLELAGNIEPPLVLDQDSYRAVVRVLAASRKSERESRVATLRTRSWPPWRVDQDGMDAQRSLEEDFSRVISAAARTKESGYREDVHDGAMRIFGGLEPDGTPTIQTRTLMKRRAPDPSNLSFNKDKDLAQIWAARVEATRDVQEAWAAFTEYQRRGLKPHLAMYIAMFQKLNYANALSGRQSQDHAPPGDGREVLHIPNDNFTVYYRLRLQPPTLDVLYQQMMESGLRPQGRCLMFLVSHARTTDHGFRYLRDSGVNELAIEYLAGGSETRISPAVLEKIPDRLFYAFIRLSCRFAPRGIRSSPGQGSGSDDSEYSGKELEGAEEINIDKKAQKVRELRPKSWTVVEMQPQKLKHLRFRNPLHHVAFLLRQRKILFRPAWYALFQALAKPGVLISRNLLGDPKNDFLSWRVLLAALNDFHNCGLELDPAGFIILCQGFEKFATAFNNSKEHREALMEGKKLIQSEFVKLSESQEASYHMPKFFHSISGTHLHAYVRVLGVTGDGTEILSVMEWMVENNQELEAVAEETRSGHALIKRSIVAIKLFLSNTKHEEMASGLAEQIGWWGGWPREDAVVEYLERGSRNTLHYDVEDREVGDDDSDHHAEHYDRRVDEEDDENQR